MKNTNFEFTEDNTIIGQCVQGNYLDCPAHSDDFSKQYSNGVEPLFPTFQDNKEDFFKGKTISKFFEDEDGNIIVCFEDNSFVIRYRFKGEKFRELPIGMEFLKEDRFWFLPKVPSSFVVFEGHNPWNYERDTIIVKMTAFGQWLHEHTDADVVSYYETVKKKREDWTKECKERAEREEKERELKQLAEVKSKYSLTESWLSMDDERVYDGEELFLKIQKKDGTIVYRIGFYDRIISGLCDYYGWRGEDGREIEDDVIAWMPIPKSDGGIN